MYKRGAGVLAHITSFETNYGIGDLGEVSIKFLEFLENASLRYWQILPLSPTSFGDSPYQSFSTFAGNTLLISPLELVKENYLSVEDLENNLPKDFVEYGDVIKFKNHIFRIAFENFRIRKSKKEEQAFNKFIKENESWLFDYCLFISLKQYFIEKRKEDFLSEEYIKFAKENEKYLTKVEVDDYYYGGMWLSFPEDIKNREAKAIENWSTVLKTEIEYNQFLQFKFFEQWEVVRKEAKKRNIEIIGDLPIFVAMDSSDVWANKTLFDLDKYGRPKKVAGVPPDYFSKTGQLWGNPLYDFKEHKKDKYAWWIKRFESAKKMFDITRIDHFRAFSEYWAIPFGEMTAVKGKWEKGPSYDFFDTIFANIDDMKIIAEDLGTLTEDVLELRDYYSLPGMKILQFAFTSEENLYLPHNFTTDNCIIYTGTHDNDTTKGFYENASEKEKDYIRRYLNISGENICYDLIRLCYSSNAKICIIPIQDILELGTKSRMNTPSKKDGNWQFRFSLYSIKPDYSNTLKYFAKIFNRENKVITEEKEKK